MGDTFFARVTPQQAREKRLAELRSDLELVRAKRREVLTAGQSVSVSGGVSVTQSQLRDLAREESRIQREILVMQGVLMRTAPDFGGYQY